MGGYLLVHEQPIRRGGERMDSLHKTCTRLGAMTFHHDWRRDYVKATPNFALSLGTGWRGHVLWEAAFHFVMGSAMSSLQLSPVVTGMAVCSL